MEVLLASAILIFFLAGLLALFVSCILLNEDNRNVNFAISHAQYIMEGIKHRPFGSIQTEINNGTWNGDTSNINTKWGLSVLPAETITTTVSDVDPLGGNNLLQVSVSVHWQGRWNNPGLAYRSADLQTCIVNQ